MTKPDATSFNVLFLCTGNSARSILAESLLNHLGKGRFRAFSAGSHPGGHVNPLVLEYLDSVRVPAQGARSKSWDEFAGPDAPAMDFVITVCDQAAGEVCPVWPGQPISAHWGLDDPARYMDDPVRAMEVIREVARTLMRRLEIFINLPLEKLDRLSLQKHVRDIAESARP